MKKLIVFLCTFLIVLSIPVAVFASTDSYSVTSLKNIAADYDITINLDNYFVCFESNGYVYVQTYARSNYKPCLSSDGSYYLSNGTGYVQYDEYKFLANNIYTQPSYRHINDNYTPRYASPIFKYSNVDIYNSESGSDVVFHPSQAPQGTQVILGKAITTQTLSGVLNEVTSILPVLLPSLILFISIRKGLKFTLRTLRMA